MVDRIVEIDLLAEDAINRHIRRRLRNLRLFNGMHLKDVAAALGVSLQQVQKYETLGNLRAKQLKRVAEAFDVHPAYFYEDLNRDQNTTAPHYTSAPVDIAPLEHDQWQEALIEILRATQTIKSVSEQNINHALGHYLRRVRCEGKIKLCQLAESVGVTTRQIRKYETGIDGISAARLWQFSEILAVPINSFFGAINEAQSLVDQALVDQKADAQSDGVHPLSKLSLLVSFNQLLPDQTKEVGRMARRIRRAQLKQLAA